MDLDVRRLAAEVDEGLRPQKDCATICRITSPPEASGGPKISWLTPTPPLPSDSASDDANAPWIEVERPEALTPVELRYKSSALCFGSLFGRE